MIRTGSSLVQAARAYLTAGATKVHAVASHLVLPGDAAEKLRASVSIAMAMNPKLRVIRVRDGSLLDEDGLRLLAEMADKSDYQIWIERVDSSGKVGFVLEDGHLKVEHREAAK